MRFVLRTGAAVLFVFSSIGGMGQGYSFKQYRVEDGLPTDIVKGCSQDSLGYFWIATDEGLVKYDGISFTTYPNAIGNYAKGFLRTKSGKLVAFGDLGIAEVLNLGDTVHFCQSVRSGVFPPNLRSHIQSCYLKTREDHFG